MSIDSSDFEKRLSAFVDQIRAKDEWFIKHIDSSSAERWFDRTEEREHQRHLTRDHWRATLRLQQEVKKIQLREEENARQQLKVARESELQNRSHVLANTFVQSPFEKLSDADILDDGLDLRRLRSEASDPDFPRPSEQRHGNFQLRYIKKLPGRGFVSSESDESDVEQDWPSDWGEDRNTGEYSSHKDLGIVRTSNDGSANTGRIVSFPNWIQHKVQGVRHQLPDDNGSDGIAKRKILCFFLVHQEKESPRYHAFEYYGIPKNGPITTADLDHQEQSCNVPTLRFFLLIASQRLADQKFPAEIVALIIHFVGASMTRQEAEEPRRHLMRDRKPQVGYSWFGALNKWESEYSLCEY